MDGTLTASKEALDLLPSSKEAQEKVSRLTKVQYAITMLSDVRKSIAKASSAMSVDMARRMSLDAVRAEALASLGCSPEEMEQGIAQLKLDHNAALTALNNMRKLSGASDSNGTCPICGSQVSPGQISAHTSSELARLEAEEASTRKVYEDMNSEFTKIRRSISAVDTEIAALDSSLASAQAALSADKERERKMLEEFAELGVMPEQIGDLGKLKESVDNELTEYNALSSRYNELTRSVAMLQGERNAKMQQLQQTREMLDAKVKEKELQAPVAAKLEKLQAVRDWFHVSNGPRVLSMNAIKGMTAYVNDFMFFVL